MSSVRAQLDRIRVWVRHHADHFRRTDFWPGWELKQAAIVLAAWALPAIAGVIATDWLSSHLSVKYLQMSVQEGIGPHIWNVFAVLGIIFAALLIAAPRQKWLAIAAYQVLQNTYALGALMFGLLLGQWICVTAPENDIFLITATSLVFVFAFCLNFSIWYVAFLVSPARLDAGFRHSIAQMKPQLRLPSPS
ncbi:hypothetical protein PAN31117_05066 [Pandoraea anapnoica]|uniref:Transmembrane protein n=1 Tax=Pandoraea anapnoica TaxID=2508301 RepID=A0A5E5ASF9_9BURK|nr:MULTISPECIES: hypothetical protein [Pandoraea]VVE58622.1 hypothetical protein PIN31009_05334 [Pandoraea iniqua]VVE75040.1 hypothetical protein PAN31117_05066 [Pandoraea anapnoica]